MFSTETPCDVTVSELSKELAETRLTGTQRQLFQNLSKRSYIDGAVTGDYLSDGLAFAKMYRADFENAVIKSVEHAGLTENQKHLAYEIALFSFSIGLRERGEEAPEYLQNLVP